jgi:putative membrane protein
LRRPVDYIFLYLKGLSIGAADVIPGVSGGTVALITGIYNELIHSIRSVDGQAVSLVRQLRFADCWKKINGNFLAPLLAGILTSLLLLAGVMNYLLKNHPILIWSFFFGLILISAPLILREVKLKKPGVFISFVLGITIAYLITVLTPTESPEQLWFIFFAGMLAICAMILPGISGAFILLLLGKYQYMVNALLDKNLPVIVVFALGCVAGILSFSRLLAWILDNYYDGTVALLAGFMLGSLNKIWPWRQVLEYNTSESGERVSVFDKSVLPWDYLNLTGKDPQLFQAIIMMALGVLIVVSIEKIAASLKTKI